MDRLSKRFPRYSHLLKLYPASYRSQYGEQMLQTLADMLDDQSTRSGRAVVWARLAIDVPFSLSKQQLQHVGGVMRSETPSYVKHSSLLGAGLLTPFFVFLVLSTVTGHDFYYSWFWHTRVIFTWLIAMPAVALLLASGTLVRWSLERRHRTKANFWRNLFDFYHNWPMLLIAGLSVGIIALAFGHDSVHCVVDNPVKELRNWHTTWTCIKQG